MILAMPVRPIGMLGAGRQALETSGYCGDLGSTPAFYLETEPPLHQRDQADYAAPLYRSDRIHELDLGVAVPWESWNVDPGNVAAGARTGVPTAHNGAPLT